MLIVILQLENREKFLKTVSAQPTAKNNYKQFKSFDLENIQVEVIKNISRSVDAADCVPVPVVTTQSQPEERWQQCYVSFEK